MNLALTAVNGVNAVEVLGAKIKVKTLPFSLFFFLVIAQIRSNLVEISEITSSRGDSNLS